MLKRESKPSSHPLEEIIVFSADLEKMINQPLTLMGVIGLHRPSGKHRDAAKRDLFRIRLKNQLLGLDDSAVVELILQPKVYGFGSEPLPDRRDLSHSQVFGIPTRVRAVNGDISFTEGADNP